MIPSTVATQALTIKTQAEGHTVPALISNAGGNARFAYEEFFRATIKQSAHQARLRPYCRLFPCLVS